MFPTRLKLKRRTIETVKDLKLLGTVITNNLKLDENTMLLVKRAYAKMEILRQMANFTNSVKDKTHVYKTYIRSVLEQSSVVWSSAITRKNINELERVQKVAIRLISKSEEPYKEKLKELNLETLQDRRNKLSVRFAEKCVRNPKTKSMFRKKHKRTYHETQKQRKVPCYPCKNCKSHQFK